MPISEYSKITLFKLLNKIQFCQWNELTMSNLEQGDPYTYIIILRHAIQAYPATAHYLLTKYDWFIIDYTDTVFLKKIYKLLKEEFDIVKPSITELQFFKAQFSVKKVDLCILFINKLTVLNKKLNHSPLSTHSASITRNLKSAKLHYLLENIKHNNILLENITHEQLKISNLYNHSVK